jgi:hypothetical protein
LYLAGTVLSREVVLLRLASQPLLNPLQGRLQGSLNRTKWPTIRRGASLPSRYSKVTKALRQAQVTSTKAKSGKSSRQNPNPRNPTPPPQYVKSPVKEISDLFDNEPLGACVELTRRLLTAEITLPSGAARWRAVLKIVVLFVAE